MNCTLDVTVIIPSLNPDEKLSRTVDDLIAVGFDDIILVNDGSLPECVRFFPSDRPECTLLTHEVNRGEGAAMKTASHLEYASSADRRYRAAAVSETE